MNSKENKIQVKFRLPGYVSRGPWVLREIPNETDRIQFSKYYKVVAASKNTGLQNAFSYWLLALAGILLLALGYWRHYNKKSNEQNTAQYSKLLESVKKEIQLHLSENIDFHEMAKNLGYSESNIRRLFRAAYSETPNQYLQRARVEEAKSVLKDTELSVNQIGYKVGYSDPSYFIKVFKKSEKMTPSEWRDSSRRN